MENSELLQLFKERYEVIAPILGYLDTMKLIDLSNTQMVLDFDKDGHIKHMSLTKHYRT
jgi:hypothetical protein